MRRKRRRQYNIILVVLGIGVLIVLLNQVDRIGIIGGNWNAITNLVLSYFGQLVGISLGFVLAIRDKGKSSTTPIRIMMLLSFIGVMFASLFFEMYNDGVWIDEIITASYTITDFQFTVLLFFFIIGIILGLMKRR